MWVEAGENEVCFLENAEGPPKQTERRGLRRLAQAGRSGRARRASVWVKAEMIQ